MEAIPAKQLDQRCRNSDENSSSQTDEYGLGIIQTDISKTNNIFSNALNQVKLFKEDTDEKWQTDFGTDHINGDDSNVVSEPVMLQPYEQQTKSKEGDQLGLGNLLSFSEVKITSLNPEEEEKNVETHKAMNV